MEKTKKTKQDELFERDWYCSAKEKETVSVTDKNHEKEVKHADEIYFQDF